MGAKVILECSHNLGPSQKCKWRNPFVPMHPRTITAGGIRNFLACSSALFASSLIRISCRPKVIRTKEEQIIQNCTIENFTVKIHCQGLNRNSSNLKILSLCVDEPWPIRLNEGANWWEY